jgi:acyl carrier protein
MGSYAHIRELLIEKYEVSAEAIRPEATLAELGLDSLSVAEMLFDVADKYDIDIPDASVQLSTLGEAAALVDEVIRQKGN